MAIQCVFDLTTGAWSAKLLRPLGVELPLNVMRIDVLYWTTLPDYTDVCTAASNHSDHPMGVFINCEDDEDIHFYGLPAFEHPGLVKVCLMCVIEIL